MYTHIFHPQLTPELATWNSLEGNKVLRTLTNETNTEQSQKRRKKHSPLKELKKYNLSGEWKIIGSILFR